jgi:hypothetical protein
MTRLLNDCYVTLTMRNCQVEKTGGGRAQSRARCQARDRSCSIMTRLVGDCYVTLTMTDSLVKDRWRASRIKREMVAQAAVGFFSHLMRRKVRDLATQP